jgi:hypothetical protein
VPLLDKPIQGAPFEDPVPMIAGIALRLFAGFALRLPVENVTPLIA